MSPLPTSIVSFPPEIFYRICHYLDRNSLLALALSSKPCDDLCRPFRFRTISIHHSDPQRLVQDVELWSGRVVGIDRIHVHELIIEGWISTIKYPDHDHWTSLAEFVRELPNLSTVTWDSSNHFPPSLLTTLQAHLPACKVDLKRFLFRLEPVDRVLDPDDFTLLTSPSLHSIATTGSRFHPRSRRENYTNMALFDIVERNPSLKKVTIRWVRAMNRPGLVRAYQSPRPPWEGFKNIDIDTPKSPSRALALEEFKMVGIGWDEEFEYYSEHFDLSKLQTLITWELHPIITGETDRRPKLDSLKKLKTRMIDPDLESGTLSSEQVDRYNSFIHSLPPLSELSVKGNAVHPSTIDAIISRHGGSLVKLQIEPLYRWVPLFQAGLGDMLRFRTAFTQLTELALPIRHCRGHETEAAIYTTLGSLPKLQTITLHLDDEGANDISLGEWEQQYFGFGESRCPRNGQLKDTLMNSVNMDEETLARSIFECISSAKGLRSYPLEELTLLPTRGRQTRDYGHGPPIEGLGTIIEHNLKWKWKLKRGERDDQRHIVFATAIDKPIEKKQVLQQEQT
ncbi:hypothetical protein A1O3_07701 [Capronia epimyces CBS 606.96]|uniref:F-box domain-containing protein n=1 Tax=Capronia epimyces CBS 606.96 TaxID=1182542 RepID=W9YGL2_9EURO|nr:uncharacterized protein A1O3_07701 [Capronia epimyces CBS 606.96]EXJ81409.1 hypothetical protein A1O3_07701 [Capronia epimyces CBS 606.96]